MVEAGGTAGEICGAKGSPYEEDDGEGETGG